MVLYDFTDNMIVYGFDMILLIILIKSDSVLHVEVLPDVFPKLPGHPGKEGELKKSVVVGIPVKTLKSGQTLLVKHNGGIEKFGGSRNFWKNVNNPAKR